MGWAEWAVARGVSRERGKGKRERELGRLVWWVMACLGLEFEFEFNSNSNLPKIHSNAK